MGRLVSLGGHPEGLMLRGGRCGLSLAEAPVAEGTPACRFLALRGGGGWNSSSCWWEAGGVP